MPPSNIQDIYKQQGWNDIAAINADIAAGGWKSKVPAGSFSSGGASSTDPMTNNALTAAKAVQQFNIDAAQPQIATLTQSKNDLGTQYKQLLDSIKGDQTLATNNTTKATNATIAARGLSTQDPMAQTNLAGAQSAAAQPYSDLIAKTGIGQAQDESAIAAQIAALQSGNPTGAISSGLQINSLSEQARQADEERKANEAQQTIANQIAQAQLANQTKETNYNVGKPYSTADNGLDFSGILSMLGGGSSSTEARPTYVAKVGTYSPDGQWYQTNDGWAPVVP